MEPEGSLPCSQEPSAGPYSELELKACPMKFETISLLPYKFIFKCYS
jgi:hypothetical protein